jgi:acyl carrier protein
LNLNKKLVEVIVSTLNIPQDIITDQLAMTDVESWDSLKHMDLIASLEQAYGVEFTFEEIVSMKSVAEIKRVLGSKGAEV